MTDQQTTVEIRIHGPARVRIVRVDDQDRTGRDRDQVVTRRWQEYLRRHKRRVVADGYESESPT